MSDISSSVSPSDSSDSGATPVTCALCTREVEPEDLRYLNGRPACPECMEGVLRELADQRPQPISLLVGGVGGLVGALLGAGVWAVIAVVTKYEIGFIAVLVGWA